jgi:hypothetical protein
MEYLWKPYGTSWEQPAGNTGPRRSQLACNTPGGRVPHSPAFQVRTLSLMAARWLAAPCSYFGLLESVVPTVLTRRLASS